ncbi:MAG: ribonuclease P protein component [Cycloclasticus sp.]
MSLISNKSKQNTFKKTDRLNTSADYSNVFKGAKRSKDNLFTVLAKGNHDSFARLGLAIAKKSVKKATQRNLIKRIVRETFRRQKDSLKAHDFVVLCRDQAALANKKELSLSIQKHWEKTISNE